MKLFSGSADLPLAEKIAQHLGLDVSPVELHVFPDGERRVKLNAEVAGEEVVIVQPTATPVDQNYMELFFLIDAANRAGATSVTAVIPYFGYQRQDHVFREGEAVSLRVMIGMLQSLGVVRVIAVDLHSIKIPEMFPMPIVHLSALELFAEEVKRNGWSKEDTFLVSPDMGGIRRIKQISEMLGGMPYIATVKDRDLVSGDIETGKIDGDKSVIKKRALIVDDMASSGKTLVKAEELLGTYGVEESYAFVTHPIFSVDAPKLLQESNLQHVYVTDTVFVPKEKRFEKLEIISTAGMIAEQLKLSS